MLPDPFVWFVDPPLSELAPGSAERQNVKTSVQRY